MSKTVNELKRFDITDDQILDVLILFESRQMDAAKQLRALMFDKWNISTLHAHTIIVELKKELKL